MISVIIPTYNGEKTLTRAIQSVWIQDVNAEVIVVDDCSTDDTRDIAESMRVRIETTERHTGGPNVGRNIGLDMAEGEYICMLDQDDEFLPGKLEKQLEAIEKADFVFTGYRIKNLQKDHERFVGKNSEEVSYYNDNSVFHSLLKREYEHAPYMSSIIFRRENMKKFEENYGKVDYDWLLRMTENKRVAQIWKPYVLRYVDGNNLSLDLSYRKIDFYTAMMVLEEYEDKFPRQVENGMKRLHGSRAKYFYYTENLRKARRNFLKADVSLKNMLYYISSYAGYKYVNKNFKVWGAN